MAKLPNVFKPSDADINNWEDGRYRAQIVKSSMEPTSTNTGKYLKLSVAVFNEDGKKRMVTDMLNLINLNETAVEIAQRTLASICLACGMAEDEEVDDSSEFHGIDMCVILGEDKGSAKYPPKNVIKMYLPIDALDEEEE